jgi:hypothetical protein
LIGIASLEETRDPLKLVLCSSDDLATVEEAIAKNPELSPNIMVVVVLDVPDWRKPLV